MPKYLIILFCSIIGVTACAQRGQRPHRFHPWRLHPFHRHNSNKIFNPRISMYMLDQVVDVLADETEPGNPIGIGKGLQFVYNNKSILKPTVECMADFYLVGLKEREGSADGGVYYDNIGIMSNVFGGLIVQPTKWLSFSGVIGPSFTRYNVTLGFKPSVAVNFGYEHRFVGKVSYIRVYNREQHTDAEFDAYAITWGYKFF